MFLKSLLCFSMFAALASAVQGQTSRPKFDVASIRASTPDEKQTSNFPLDTSSAYPAVGGTLSARSQPLIVYIVFAYKVTMLEATDGFMKKLPEWAQDSRFDIVAKTEATNATKEDMRLMMQSLLEERFHVQAHRYQHEAPTFALSYIKAGKFGPLLKLHDPSSVCDVAPPDRPSRLPMPSLLSAWPGTCGAGDEMWTAAKTTRIAGRGMTMDAISNYLSGTGFGANVLERPIVDGTGSKGTYDFALEFATPQRAEAGQPSEVASNGTTFAEAIADQLGLRLEKKNSLVSFFAVDHIDHPTEN